MAHHSDIYLTDIAAYNAAVSATNGGHALIIDFTATWCPPCQRIGPVFERIAGEQAGSVTMKKVDVDANSEAAAAAGINCMPTFKLYKNGACVATKEGGSEAFINELVAAAKQ